MDARRHAGCQRAWLLADRSVLRFVAREYAARIEIVSYGGFLWRVHHILHVYEREYANAAHLRCCRSVS